MSGARAGGFWELSARQHGVIARRQLLELGLSPAAINHRLASGRLHRVHRGVYAVGRPQLDRLGLWLASVLACGPKAVLSHGAAAALWEIRPWRAGHVEISVPLHVCRSRPGLIVHRRSSLTEPDLSRRHQIPVTSPLRTLVDLAPRLTVKQLEAAINEADKRGLVDPECARASLGSLPARAGVGRLRGVLDRRTFALTDSELERAFLRLTRRAGLPKPLTGSLVAGHRADFHWPQLGLVVETDGLRYHRTPAQQAKDRERDQDYVTAGLTALRFTHSQVRFEPDHVVLTLQAVATRLARQRG